jgi:solute:Na+ symporter, SSS family
VHDIWLPLTGKEVDEKKTFRMARGFSLAWGAVLLIAALLYRQQGTPVVVVALSIASFTYGALLGGFFLGILWRRAIQRDAMLGMAVAIVVMAFIVFAKQLIPVFPSMTETLTMFGRIAWPWYVLIGTVITLVVGIISSYTHGARARHADD